MISAKNNTISIELHSLDSLHYNVFNVKRYMCVLKPVEVQILSTEFNFREKDEYLLKSSKAKHPVL